MLPIRVIPIIGCAIGLGLSQPSLYAADPAKRLSSGNTPPIEKQPKNSEEKAWWIEPLPVPFDPELESLIVEVQESLITLNKQMVRRKERLKDTEDPSVKAQLYEELEALRKEQTELEGLLHQLVNEAKISQRTEIDEALAKARWLEQQQERWYQKEELLRDRQE
ncbi:MAG: hypothetical protein HYT88_03640 [Candidatus Omnitrophica bacterium]|nr:hypothetical protein [Candidatus Omnitrophota bacterium]MBI2174084.1 hypothetical protein [Candidatus Omnitrophota bacterium]MBI3010128.1 hypothetical protein [Candidatus Omnitrophota bacterium]